MTDPIVTTATSQSPWVLVEVADGRVSTLQLRRNSLDREQYDAVVAAVVTTVNQALGQQADAAVAALDAVEPEPADPDRDRALAFAERALAMAQSPSAATPSPPSDDGFPDEAAGTAGEAEARLVRGEVVELSFPLTLLDRDDTLPAETAMRDAINDALAHQDDAVATFIAGVDTSRSTSPDWASLAQRADRIDRGLL